MCWRSSWTNRIPSRSIHLLAALWFAAMACAVSWRVVLRGEVLYYGDIMLYFHPMLAFEHEWLLRGILPLWNPHTLFGQPFVGNPQEWLLYPSTLLVAWLGAEQAISWGAVIHLWLAGLGVYLFALRLQYPFRSALFAGTLWMLCGAVVLRSQHVGILQTLAWYGWCLWAVEGFVQKASVLRTTWLSATLALGSLAGSPQMWHMLLLMLMAWTVYRWRAVEDKWQTLRQGALAVAVSVLIGSVHWLPLAELLRHTDRDRLRVFESAGYALHPDHLLLFLAPNLFGFPWQGNYALTMFYWELAFFVGTVPALVALIRWRKAEGTERFWRWTTVLSLWLAVGPYGGLYWLAYHLIPGMQSFRTPLRWTAIADLAICLWASSALQHVHVGRRWWRLPMGMLALGVVWQALARPLIPAFITRADELQKALRLADTISSAWWRAIVMCTLALIILSVQNNRRWWLAFGVTVAELLWIAVPANPTCSPEVFAHVPEAVSTLRESGQRLFVPDTSPIWLRYVNAHYYGSGDTTALRNWRETLASNIGMAHGVSEASGYEPAPLRHSQQQVAHLQSVWRDRPEDLQLAGIGMIAFGEDAETWRLQPANKPGARAWMKRNGEPVAWRMLSPQRFVLSPSSSGELVLADSAYPGWRVRVDGAPAEWHVHEQTFRAVRIPAGAKKVEWRYAPDTFRIGLYLTCVGVGCLSALMMYSVRRQSPKPERPPAPPRPE